MRQSKKQLSGFSILEMMIVFMVIGVMSMAVMQGKKLIRRSKIQQITQIIAGLEPYQDSTLEEANHALKRIAPDLGCTLENKKIHIGNADKNFFSTTEAQQIQTFLELQDSIVDPGEKQRCNLIIPEIT